MYIVCRLCLHIQETTVFDYYIDILYLSLTFISLAYMYCVQMIGVQLLKLSRHWTRTSLAVSQHLLSQSDVGLVSAAQNRCHSQSL